MTAPAPSSAAIAADLHRLIVDELVGEPFRGEDPLAEGAVDSLGYEQLIDHIESTYSVRLEDTDIVAEHFESIPALVALIESKLE